MFYIPISNGLLFNDHHEKMGAAVWMFMWCIDKITKIDDEGLGWVLGGKPIKLNEVPFPRRTTQRYISNLKKHGYIVTLRTPYGTVIKVTKAKKLFNRSAKNGASSTRDAPKMAHPDVPDVAHLDTRSGASNKTRQKTRQLISGETPEPPKDMSWNKRYRGEDDHYDESAIDLDTGETILPPKEKADVEKKELRNKMRHNVRLLFESSGFPEPDPVQMNWNLKHYEVLLKRGWTHEQIALELITLAESDYWKEQSRDGKFPTMQTVEFSLRNKVPEKYANVPAGSKKAPRAV